MTTNTNTNFNNSSTLFPDSNTAHLDIFGASSPLDFRHSSSCSSAPIYGTPWDDVITAKGRSIVFAGEGVNLITTGLGNDVIYSGGSSDFIDAGGGKNTIFAGEGNNRIVSRDGNDVIYAGAGNDTIYSGKGNDTIYAGAGNNVINAGTGRDSLYLGSTGKDKLILEAGGGSVTVTGFNITSDKLRLGESLLGKSLRFVSNNGDTLVFSGRDLLATLKGVATGSQALVDNGPLYRYQATDLGSLSTNPNGAVNAASINDFGQIAGRFDTGATFTNTNATTGLVQPNNPVRQGFLWENGTFTALTSTGVKNGQSDFGAADGATINTARLRNFLVEASCS
jgi:Ca2+-binding RTX toxin-like protein